MLNLGTVREHGQQLQDLPRVIATDLDGTVLNSAGIMSDLTRSALDDAAAAGIHVLFITARPPRWLDGDAHSLYSGQDHHMAGNAQVIALGGAVVWDPATETASAVDGFSDSQARDIVADLRSHIPGISLGFERPTQPAFDPDFISIAEDDVAENLRNQPVEHTLASHDAHSQESVCKILARMPGDSELAANQPATTAVAATAEHEDFFVRIGQVLGPRAILAYSGAGGMAEIFAPHVTKATALARWCASRSIDASQVWAFGDMPNDLPMMQWAGRSIAVANAHPDILARADAIVRSNDDDGVDHTIRLTLTQGYGQI